MFHCLVKLSSFPRKQYILVQLGTVMMCAGNCFKSQKLMSAPSIASISNKKNSPNPDHLVPGVVHDAPRGQHVQLADGLRVHHRIEHLRQLRVLSTEHLPFVALHRLADYVASHQLAWKILTTIIYILFDFRGYYIYK